MKISIKLRDNREIITEIGPEDFEEMKQGLTEGKIKFLHLENRLIKVDQVISIEPAEGQTIPKQFRLSEPEFKSIDTAGRMKEFWNLLKGKGLFNGVNSYEEFRNRKGY